ncbi:hypothetical protein [Undibacterium sp. YM2]|uniref:hypothetical protein n=1 Tax=Undibacterium sp. YM2 TaxID=2058625 RepID=UPI001389A1E8|nr:hypothetical protein [Undibacterium sp. YM2]
MGKRIREILRQITALEGELKSALDEKESELLYHFNGKRVKFTGSIRAAHRKLKLNVFRWIVVDRPQNFLTGPLIYGLIFPIVFLDMYVSLYQLICFPIYKIEKVRRADYISFDRQHLQYLNFFERFHCVYCSYANGLLAYVSEIAARTEQYFCPIKHAQKLLGSHARYARFLAYGDAADYHAKLEEYRIALQNEKSV